MEPNHSHFVLVEKDNWGGEKETIFKIIKHFSKDASVLTILVNGGKLSKFEVLNSVGEGYLMIIIEGSGRMADEIVELWKKKPKYIEDPLLAEIIAEGKIHLFKIEDSVENIKRLINRLIEGNTMLRQAWKRFALYDSNAGNHQSSFNMLQISILALAVLGTFFAIVQAELNISLDSTFILNSLNKTDIINILKYIIILIPITVSILISFTNRFKFGNIWIYLRGAAEEIKQEIYRYRIRTSIYSD